MAVLVDELKDPHRDYLVDQGLSLLLVEIDLLIEQFLKQSVGLFQSFHVDVELVSLILSF